MLLTKEVEVKPTGKMIQYYRDRGYDVKYNKFIKVKIEDLPKSSFVRVNVLCDYCKEEIFSTTYHHYNEETKHINKHACKNCWQKKKEEVLMMKYGVTSPFQLEDVQKRKKQSYINHFGVDNPNKSPEVRVKTVRTLYANSSQKASKQQHYINNIYQGILNYPIKYYSADIFLLNDNLIIEYDGSGHLLNVKMGRETIEEYNQKEIVRFNVIKREGYKQMKIISNSDKLPSDSILLQMLSEAKQYFQTYPNHSWYEYNISTSTVRNAEHPQGLPYSFGTLRTIKDSDLQIMQNETNNTVQAV